MTIFSSSLGLSPLPLLSLDSGFLHFGIVTPIPIQDDYVLDCFVWEKFVRGALIGYLQAWMEPTKVKHLKGLHSKDILFTSP